MRKSIARHERHKQPGIRFCMYAMANGDTAASGKFGWQVRRLREQTMESFAVLKLKWNAFLRTTPRNRKGQWQRAALPLLSLEDLIADNGSQNQFTSPILPIILSTIMLLRGHNDSLINSHTQRTAVLPRGGEGGVFCHAGGTRGHDGNLQGAGTLDAHAPASFSA